MDRAIHSAEQRELCRLLRVYRERAGLRQLDVAERLGMPQSFVSKYESGERRLDLIELGQVCEALGVPLVDFVIGFREATTSWSLSAQTGAARRRTR